MLLFGQHLKNHYLVREQRTQKKCIRISPRIASDKEKLRAILNAPQNSITTEKHTGVRGKGDSLRIPVLVVASAKPMKMNINTEFQLK